MGSRSEFPVQPIQRFAGKSAPIKRPEEITCFSYDVNREFRWDESSLQYYWPPSLPADLSAGFDTFNKWDDSTDEHLDGLVKALMLHEKSIGERLKTDFVTWRGMMTRFMTAPFDQFNSFDMNATLFQGTIFIEEDHPSKFEDKKEQSNRPPNRNGLSQDIMSFWGYKFESLALIPDIWDNVSRDFIESREEHIVDNIQQYCSVVYTQIGDASLVLGGEVDAVWDRKPDDKTLPINWVELKTSEEIQSERDHIKFERKLLKFWVQSFLIGCPKIIVGFRSKSGQLQRLQEIQTQSIPGTVKRGKASWNGNMCVNFAAEVLEFLKKSITSEGVWRISRKKGDPNISVYKIEETGTGQILRDDFIEWRQQLTAKEVAQMLK
ncbi:rai1 protein [Microthyrium microscopicum]|uniref:Decapping nuclease n=1 Tax=Microthyrium microscopicum TaxID=703497 RepID=A0A6A6UC59_9PEZI|nr:rai1 protein [Microthyrium microscopicum]